MVRKDVSWQEGTKKKKNIWITHLKDLVLIFFRIDRRTIKAQCFPFYSVLQAIGNPVIDLLSLDIEGAELEVKAHSDRLLES